MKRNMKSLKNLAIAAALLLAVGVADARAGLIQIGIDPVFFGSEVITDIGPGLHLGNLFLNGLDDTDYIVTFTLLGGYSGYQNTLVTPDGSLTENGDIGAGNTVISDPITGITGSPILLDFEFTTLGLSDSLKNGNNNWWTALTLERSFLVAAIGGNGDEVLIGLDDSGGGRFLDKDYNDWFGTIKISEVKTNLQSVPDGGSALALLGAALAGLGMLRRRLS